MSNEMKTSHRGYEIRYSENRDVWWCHELDLEGATLTKLKEAINKVILKANKAAQAAPALYLGHDTGFQECSITSYAGKAYGDSANQDHVWIVMPDRRGGRQRSKEPMTRLLLDTPENRAWAAELVRHQQVVRDAMKARDAFKATAPRVTLEQLIEAKVITGKIEGKDGEEA